MVYIFFRNIFYFQEFVLLCEPLHNLGPFFLFLPLQCSETADDFQERKKVVNFLANT